ncbi:type III pantothenate kinase [Rhodanobacter lindaniclasticus]
MRLLLDLGNTRLKWALQGPSPAWLAQGVLEWREDLAALPVAWADFARPSQVVGASVVDDAREQRVAAVVRHAFGGAPTWLRTPASACRVRNAYAEPQRLGVDRFLAMVAAHAAGQAPCVLASAGTALVLDALAADGRHLGGLIAPGVQLMQRSLLDATAQVRPQRPGDILQLADNTADAVTSGCWQAAAALIERFHAQMRPRLGGAPALILDGGDATQLVPLLSLPVQIGKDSVLRGLALWADAQMPAPANH